MSIRNTVLRLKNNKQKLLSAIFVVVVVVASRYAHSGLLNPSHYACGKKGRYSPGTIATSKVMCAGCGKLPAPLLSRLRQLLLASFVVRCATQSMVGVLAVVVVVASRSLHRGHVFALLTRSDDFFERRSRARAV